MKKVKQSKKQFSGMRKRAEELLGQRSEDIQTLPGEDIKRLLHELQVHQIELNMQNDELRKIQAELEESRRKYLDLYDFAPIGYITFDQKGLILEANLVAANLLGMERSYLLKRGFSRFIAPDYQDAYYLHRRRVLESAAKQTCELKLIKKDGTPFYAQLESIAVQNAQGNYNQLRTAITDIAWRKQAEKEMQETLDYAQSIVETVREPLMVLDAGLRVISANRAFYETFKVKPGETTGQLLYDLGNRQWDIPKLRELLEEILPTNTTFDDFEVEHQFKTVGRRVMHLNARRIYREINDTHSILLAIEDVTDRKRAEKALRESEERYRRITEAITDYVFTVRVEKGHPVGTIHGPACEAVTGYTSEEFNSDPYLWIRMVHEADRDVVREQASRILSGHDAQPIEHRIIRKDGSTRWVNNTPVPHCDLQGNLISYDGLIRDITERRRVEEALKESEARHRTVLEANPEPVVVYDMEGRMIYFNPAFTRVFGWTPEERLGQKMNLVVPEENWPETKMMIDKVLAGENFSDIETKRYTRDGNVIPVSISAAIYRDEDGRPVGSVINLRDIRERKMLEAQLLQAQKMEAIGTLAGGVAHDFNNLLQIVRGFTQLLLHGKDHKEPEYQALQKILHAAERGAALTRQLLTYSRKVESKRRPVDLNFEVHEVRRLLERSIPKLIEIVLHLADDVRTVFADPVQVEQMLMNLALNAKDAMADGGKIVIQTENVTLDEKYCRTHLEARPGDYVLMTFSDTGHGMDKGTLRHAFEPFFSTKEVGKGTGLGLAMVYGIVKNHDGCIMCESEPGLGTTFRIYLPVMDQEVESVEPTEVRSFSEGGTGAILLVDDEELNRELGMDLLGRSGYTVLTAVDGETALQIYRKEQRRIDLVILDLTMPGMGGWKCLEELLNINPKLRVLVTSGHSAEAPMKEAIEAGARGYLSKPYDVHRMLKLVREVLNEE
jgi:two-component system cell cycle sensor histidine kinase/response regulator CckA